MRRVAVLQPYLFPYVGYFQMIREVEEPALLDVEFRELFLAMRSGYRPVQ